MKAPRLDLDALVSELPALVPAQRAANFLGVGARCLREWIAAERVRALKTAPGRPGRLLIPRTEIRRLVEEMVR